MRTSPLKAFAKRPGNSQGLSPTALKKKRARDVDKASEQYRIDRRSENQSSKTPAQSSEYDLHHRSDGSVVKMSTNNNRNVWKHGER